MVRKARRCGGVAEHGRRRHGCPLHARWPPGGNYARTPASTHALGNPTDPPRFLGAGATREPPGATGLHGSTRWASRQSSATAATWPRHAHSVVRKDLASRNGVPRLAARSSSARTITASRLCISTCGPLWVRVDQGCPLPTLAQHKPRCLVLDFTRTPLGSSRSEGYPPCFCRGRRDALRQPPPFGAVVSAPASVIAGGSLPDADPKA